MDVLQTLIRRVVPEVKARKKTKKSKAVRMKRSESVDFLKSGDVKPRNLVRIKT